MTTSDIHYYIDQGLQRMGYFMNDHFKPEEIDVHLNKVLRSFVTVLHRAKRFEEIRTLYKTKAYPYTSGATVGVRGFFEVAFPAELFLFNSASSDVEVSGCVRKPLPIVVKDSFMEPQLIANPYSKSNLKHLLAFNSSKGLRIYVDKRVIVKGIFVEYTCKPLELDVILNPNEEPELPESTHDQIADLTIDLLKRIIESSTQ